MKATVYKKGDSYKIRTGKMLSGLIKDETLAMFVFQEMTGLSENDFNASIVEISEWPEFKLATR